MSGQLFLWGSRQLKTRLNDRWTDRFWMLGLLIAALLLFWLDLGGVSLRDWDEGIVAQVAREIWQGWNWLYPTIGETPYQNKPPLVHWLIGLCFKAGGVQEWTARLIPATLTAVSIPLLYALGRELFAQRLSAIFSALVYLTLLPVVRHGRLAMLDGAVLCFLLVTVWCLLRARRDLRYALGAGLALGLICLTKGVLLGLLLGGMAGIFLLWDTPRLLTTRYLWLGLVLGLVPVVAWYGAQWWHYGEKFFSANLMDQSLRRIWEPVGNHKGPPWYYVLEIVETSWPWQLFWLQGLRLSWENRNFAWAKLVLVWTGVYLITISVMNTKLPWYVLPIYPAFALTVGRYLAEVWHRGQETPEVTSESSAMPDPRVPLQLPYGLWPVFGLLAGVALAGCVYFGGMFEVAGKMTPTERDLQFLLVTVALMMILAAMLMRRQDRQFILILLWGTYISLLSFVSSNHWVWELAEDYPVKPVAAMVRQGTAEGQKVLTSHPYPRPSLDFYSERRVIPADREELKQKWKNSAQPHFLLNRPLKTLKLKKARIIGQAEGWLLITRDGPPDGV